MARLLNPVEAGIDGHDEELVLVLYQWNIERMNFSQEEMREEIRQIVRHELVQFHSQPSLTQLLI